MKDKRSEIIKKTLGHGLSQYDIEKIKNQHILNQKRLSTQRDQNWKQQMVARFSKNFKKEQLNANKCNQVTKHIGNNCRQVTKHVPPQQITVSPFEPLTGNFKHSGDLGDLWYSLPVLRYYGGGKIYLNIDGLKTRKYDGSKSGLNHDLINMCRPLLEVQPYISECNIFNPEFKIDVDIDLFRTILRPEQNLCHKILASFCVPLTESEIPWITCEARKISKIVFSRSFRYRNPQVNYADLVKKYKFDSIFLGFKEEYDDFVNNFGYIPYYPIKDFLEMAEIINGAELFIGNQSSPMAIAIGMNKSFIQETSTMIADCKFDRANADYMSRLSLRSQIP